MSFRVTRIAGIDINLSLAFFLILPLGALLWGGAYGLPGALFGVLMMALLFACVALHELGHALMARMLGIPVREIVLLPVGGMAVLGRSPTRPMHELLIAAAGPLVNVLLAAALLLFALGAGLLGALADEVLRPGPGAPGLTTAVLWLIQGNVILALFNLLPAFPLDGGRILRAVLWMLSDFARATRIAAVVGQVLAVGLGVLGLITLDLLLVLAAVFIFFTARAERAEAQAQPVLDSLRVGDTYNRHALRLQIGDRVGMAAEQMLTSGQSDFVVMHGGQPIGIVTRADVLRALAGGQHDLYITQIMRRDIVRVHADASLDAVRRTMAERNTRVVAIYDEEEYRGLVSIEEIAGAYSLGKLLQRRSPAQGGAA